MVVRVFAVRVIDSLRSAGAGRLFHAVGRDGVDNSIEAAATSEQDRYRLPVGGRIAGRLIADIGAA